ncbi:MAG: hypothetical protein KAT43_05480 [Nanoarchaeota archaeon]|nr:hypothetical protein [Nanoarchaeota archaeon]
MPTKPVYKIRNLRRRKADKIVQGVLERVDGGGVSTFRIPLAVDPGLKLNDLVTVRRWSIGSPIAKRKRYAILLSKVK